MMLFIGRRCVHPEECFERLIIKRLRDYIQEDEDAILINMFIEQIYLVSFGGFIRARDIVFAIFYVAKTLVDVVRGKKFVHPCREYKQTN